MAIGDGKNGEFLCQEASANIPTPLERNERLCGNVLFGAPASHCAPSKLMSKAKAALLRAQAAVSWLSPAVGAALHLLATVAANCGWPRQTVAPSCYLTRVPREWHARESTGSPHGRRLA